MRAYLNRIGRLCAHRRRPPPQPQTTTSALIFTAIQRPTNASSLRTFRHSSSQRGCFEENDDALPICSTSIIYVVSFPVRAHRRWLFHIFYFARLQLIQPSFSFPDQPLGPRRTTQAGQSILSAIANSRDLRLVDSEKGGGGSATSQVKQPLALLPRPRYSQSHVAGHTNRRQGRPPSHTF